jgi:glutathione synthase/RimK-type ligase-like ATP-grasp enzyme
LKQLTHIGIKELISLPDEQLQDVPAKIDTGADSSAIWASDIKETDSQLSFVLFAKKSPFYTGKPIIALEYQVISVKNSFGQAELRYKVPLKLVLGGRTIQAKFTLADRSKNRYPVLIGRRTLSGKFLVDSRQKPSKEPQILMLTVKHNTDNQKFTENIQRQSKRLRITYATYNDLNFDFEDSVTKITLRTENKAINRFDMVFFKTSARYMDVAAATACYLEQSSTMFIPEAVKHYPASSKLYQYVNLRESGLKVPRSVFMMPPELAKAYDYLRKSLGLPFILKDNQGRKGEHNYLIKDKSSFDKACKLAVEGEKQLIAQAFIPNNSDYRVLVFGTKIALVIKRTRTSDATHLNNTSQGAKASLVPTTDLPAIIQKGCVQAAKLLERQVAGVDIVQDKISGVWYCLEVNNGPQLATGSFTDEKQAAFAAYLERKLA